MKPLIISIFCMLIAITITNAQEQQEYVLGEVLAGISHENFSLPEGKTSAKIDEITAPISLIEVLGKYGVSEIERVFPNFRREDTLILTEREELVKIPDFSCIYKLTFPSDRGVDSLIGDLNNQSDVMYAEPNHVYQLDATPNDPYFPEQWNLHQQNNCDVNAPETWDIQVGNTAIKIGIFDSGIKYTHPDLGGLLGVGHKVTGGYNYIVNTSDISDEVGHGTHVAGIAGALTNNQINNNFCGVAGIAGGWGGGDNYGCQLFAFKIAAFHSVNTDRAARAINEAALPSGPHGYGINVMNHSWTKGPGSYSITLRQAITSAHILNRVLAVSKGNNNSDSLFYPCDYGDGGRGNLIISVGATNNEDIRWVDQLSGKGSNYGNFIDVVAPGVDILSTYINDTFLPMTGTSMAAPHVSGLAGLLFSQNPNLSCEDIQGIIQRSADDKGDPGYDIYYGYGRINAYKALCYLLNPWECRHWSETGGNITTSTDLYEMDFPNKTKISGQKGWKVKRYKIHKPVDFLSHYPYSNIIEPWVWGRNYGTKGWSLGDSNPNNSNKHMQYEEGWCDTVGGTLTFSGVTLQTYIYEVWRYMNDNSLQYIGWWPCNPQNVTFAFTVLGRRPINEPLNLNGYAMSENTICLSWLDNSNNEMGFKLEIKGGQYQDWTEIQTLNQNITNTFINNLPSRTVFEFRIRAYAQEFTSNYSNIVSIITIGTPRNLSTQPISNNEVRVAWQDNSQIENGFKIARKVNGSNWDENYAQVSTNITYFSDTVSHIHIYYYKVRAYDDLGNYSNWSDEAHYVASFAMSNYAQMTAFNNANRIVFDGQKIHLVYGTESNIQYTYSNDYGNTWIPPSIIPFSNGYLTAPVMSIDNLQRPHIIWGARINGNDNWYVHSVKNGEEWYTNEYGLSRPEQGSLQLCQPSFIIACDRGHLSISTGNKVWYGNIQFDGTGNVWQTQWECIDNLNIANDAKPSIICNGYNRKFIAYVKNLNGIDNIYLSIKIGENNWSSPILVSENTSQEHNNNPSLSVDGAGNICIVWLGNYIEPIDRGDVFTRIGTPSGDSYILKGINQISSGYVSNSPICISGNIAIWSQQSELDSPLEVFYSTYSSNQWGVPAQVSTSNGMSSNYPQACIIDNPSWLTRRLFTIWTEGNTLPYFIDTKNLKLPGLIVACDMATGPNNGTHLMRVTNTKDLYMVFQEQNQIYYAYSYDESENWKTELIDNGLYPCIGINYTDQPWIAYVKDGDLMCKIRREDGTYKEILIYDGDGNRWAGPPSMHLATMPIKEDVVDYAYITYPVYEGSMPDGPEEQPPVNNYSYIYVSLFDTTDVNKVTCLIDEGSAQAPVSHPSIGVTPADLVHICWQKDNEIYYITNIDKVTPENWQQVEWTPMYNVSESEEISKHPYVETYGEEIFVVWSEGEPGEIIRRPRVVWYGYDEWGESENISNSPEYDSDYPQMSSSDIILWQEQNQQSYKVYAYMQGNVSCLTPEANNISYVHTNVLITDAQAPAYIVYYCYTDEITEGELYEVKFDKYEYAAESGDGEFVYYEAELGKETSSTYLEARDGYLNYGNYKIDYGNNLKYKLKYLNPCKKYLFQGVLYQCTTATIQQKTEVEDTLTSDNTVSYAVPETISFWIRKNSYKNDLESKLKIKKTQGAYAVLARFKIYEYETIDSTGGSGPQSNEFNNISIPIMLYAPKPNPFTNRTEIRFQIPVKTRVDLKIYNSAGQLINTIASNEMNPGYYTMIWSGKDNQERICANGIYFVQLKTKEYDVTKKIIFTR